jgi:hypothetical protein
MSGHTHILYMETTVSTPKHSDTIVNNSVKPIRITIESSIPGFDEISLKSYAHTMSFETRKCLELKLNFLFMNVTSLRKTNYNYIFYNISLSVVPFPYSFEEGHGAEISEK